VHLLVVEQAQNGEANDERIANGQQDNRNEAAHFAGVFGRAGAQDFLHVVVGRGAGQRGKNAFKSHHHEENTEQRVAVAGYFTVDFRDEPCPVEPQPPAKKGIKPARRHRQLVPLQLDVGNDSDGHARHRHDGVLDNIAQHDAVHTAHDGVKHGKQREH
nr:hypothetical protein [Tanacetum cinerariifolium]